MSIHTLKRKQFLPITLEESWEFFSDPNNLKLITPPSLGLEITSEIKSEIYEGMIITYDVKPLPGITTTWVTQITHIKKPYYFIDEQRIGPYRLWHHQHFFKKKNDGIIAEDLIHYAVPFGPLGNLLNSIYIQNNLDKIFTYRKTVLNGMFEFKPKKTGNS